MTTYVINPFVQWELPTFDPTWRGRCETCVHCSTRTTQSSKEGLVTALRCRHSGTGPGHVSCFSYRFDGACGPSARLRVERVV